MKVLAYNKRAHFDYEIQDIYEAGLVLFGHEVKSVRTKKPSMKGSFVTVKGGKKGPELYLTNCHISKYSSASTVTEYTPDRPRKLLVHRRDINRLVGKKQEQGLTLVPLKIYSKNNLIKLEFGVGRGKKKHDKREDIKKRDIDRNIRVLMRNKV